MTLPRTDGPSPTGGTPLHRIAGAAGAFSALWLAAACTSVPLPPPAAPRPAPVAQVPAPAPETVVPVEPAVPIPIQPVEVLPAEPVAAPAPPYGPAVAARFPDPVARYETPGLQDGRTEFTTQDELRAQLSELIGRDGRGPQMLTIGHSASGLPIEAIVFAQGATDLPGLAASGRPTVLLIGQQHGDEPAGSEALIFVSRELARGKLAKLLDRINVVVVPRANPDGAAQRNRLSNGVDINRDHLLLKTPEAQALAQLSRDLQPAVVVDAHEYTVVGRYLQKFNAIQRYDALVQYAMTANLPDFLTRASEEWFRRPLLAALKREQLTAEWYYTTSTDLEDRTVSMGGVQPDTGRNVNGLKNAVSFLIETRGVGLDRLHIQRRVHTHVTAISSVLASAAARGQDLMKLRHFVAADVASKACQGTITVEAAPTRTEYELTMLDPDTGADKRVPVDWNSSLTLVPRKLRSRPCGYWLAAEATDAVTRLRQLGVTVQQLGMRASVPGDTYRETGRREGARTDVRGTIADAGGVVSVDVQLVDSLVDLPSGSYFVPLAQPLALLAIAALEPDTQNSFLANGILPSTTQIARLRGVPNANLMPLP